MGVILKPAGGVGIVPKRNRVGVGGGVGNVLRPGRVRVAGNKDEVLSLDIASGQVVMGEALSMPSGVGGESGEVDAATPGVLFEEVGVAAVNSLPCVSGAAGVAPSNILLEETAAKGLLCTSARETT